MKSNKDQKTIFFLDATIFLATNFFSFFSITFCIGFTRTEKKYVKVTDDDICNMDAEIKAKSEIMKRKRNYKKVDKKIWRALNMESLQSSISTIRLLKDCFRRYLVFGNYFFDQLKHTFLANLCLQRETVLPPSRNNFFYLSVHSWYKKLVSP